MTRGYERTTWREMLIALAVAVAMVGTTVGIAYLVHIRDEKAEQALRLCLREHSLAECEELIR